jgi:5'-nucleotidase (lipoprotein e(P4) family)
MKYFFICSIALLAACSPTKKNTSTVVAPAIETPKNISLNAKLVTAMFQQYAAEYRALCFQAYNLAKLRIDTYKPQTNKPLAFITDIDETILDNSPYAVKQSYTGIEYTLPSWKAWTDRAEADTMPGAAHFLQYAKSKNVQVFYITNRGDNEKQSTIKNLKRFGLPNADEQHVFTKFDVSSKEKRRQNVLQNYEVVLYMGDNLADLHVSFDKKSQEDRRAAVDALAGQFGFEYIVFPNVNYGDWENAFFGKSGLTQAQKDSVFAQKLKQY